MLNKFLNSYKKTERFLISDDRSFYKNLPSELYRLLEIQGGTTFDNGLYRIHTFGSSLKWSLLIAEFFNDYAGKIYPFGYDWMGRQFCSNTTGNMLFMFDPATEESFELEQTIGLLHDDDFVSDKDGMLASKMFEQLLHDNRLTGIQYNECFGYKIPLFLGGKDSIENYKLQDIEVYWHIGNQLYKKVKDLPDGTKIGSVSLE